MRRDPYATIQRSAPRKRRPGKRRGPWRSRAYREWISRHASVVSFDARVEATGPGQQFPEPISQACHTRNNGTSSKGGDEWCVPLSAAEHREYDAGRAAFEAKYKLNMEATAFEYYSYWYERNGPKEGLPVPEPENTIE